MENRVTTPGILKQHFTRRHSSAVSQRPCIIAPSRRKSVSSKKYGLGVEQSDIQCSVSAPLDSKSHLPTKFAIQEEQSNSQDPSKILQNIPDMDGRCEKDTRKLSTTSSSSLSSLTAGEELMDKTPASDHTYPNQSSRTPSIHTPSTPVTSCLSANHNLSPKPIRYATPSDLKAPPPMALFTVPETPTRTSSRVPIANSENSHLRKSLGDVGPRQSVGHGMEHRRSSRLKGKEDQKVHVENEWLEANAKAKPCAPSKHSVARRSALMPTKQTEAMVLDDEDEAEHADVEGSEYESESESSEDEEEEVYSNVKKDSTPSKTRPTHITREIAGLLKCAVHVAESWMELLDTTSVMADKAEAGKLVGAMKMEKVEAEKLFGQTLGVAVGVGGVPVQGQKRKTGTEDGVEDRAGKSKRRA